MMLIIQIIRRMMNAQETVPSSFLLMVLQTVPGESFVGLDMAYMKTIPDPPIALYLLCDKR